MTTPTIESGGPGLVGHLEALAKREDRAALAALRRGLGKQPGEAPEMFPYVERHFDARGSHGAPDEAYTVASIFGIHPVHHRPAERRERNNFGASLRAIRWKDGEENQGVERRFVALLDAGREALPVHLRHLVTLLHSSSEPMAIDYLQLFYDLRLWGEPDRRVQKRWAAGFWGFRRDDETSSNEVTTTDQRNDESSED